MIKKISSAVKFQLLLGTFFLLITPIVLMAQKNKGLSGVEVVKAGTQEVLGVNVGFVVEFRNNNDQAVDAIRYSVIYYDGFDEKMGEKNFQWQSGNLVKKMESGKTIKDIHGNWIKGANKIKVIITKVHLVGDGDQAEKDNY